MIYAVIEDDAGKPLLLFRYPAENSFAGERWGDGEWVPDKHFVAEVLHAQEEVRITAAQAEGIKGQLV